MNCHYKNTSLMNASSHLTYESEETGDSTPRLYDIEPSESNSDSRACYVFSPLSRSIKLENLSKFNEFNFSHNIPSQETQVNSYAQLEKQEKGRLEIRIEDLEKEVKALRRMKVLLREKDRIVGNIEMQLEKKIEENKELTKEVKNLQLENIALSCKNCYESHTEIGFANDPEIRVKNVLDNFKQDLTEFISRNQRKRSRTPSSNVLNLTKY